MELGAIREPARAEELERRLRGRDLDELVLVVRPNRQRELIELQPKEIAFARHSLVLAALIEDERLLAGGGVHNAPAARCQDHDDTIALLRLEEHVAQLVAE